MYRRPVDLAGDAACAGEEALVVRLRFGTVGVDQFGSGSGRKPDVRPILRGVAGFERTRDAPRDGQEASAKRPSVERAASPQVASTELPCFMLRPVQQTDVAGKTVAELELMRNEIFARYGRKFGREDLQDYFNRRSWYQPKYEPDGLPITLLTDIQKANVAALLAQEQQAKQ
jgi:hypothetical protein